MQASVTYPCRQCQAPLERALDGGDAAPCAQCGAAQELSKRYQENGAVLRCPACDLKVLYRQKDFRQALGCVVVLVASILAPFTFYLSLVAAALIDAVLYWLARDVVICYGFQCRAHIRGLPPGPGVLPFDLSIHDYYRGLARESSEPGDESPTSESGGPAGPETDKSQS